MRLLQPRRSGRTRLLQPRRALVSTLLEPVSTHCPSTAQKVTMKFKRMSKSGMGMHPSDERSNYESVYS
ncbi:hypothetical protein Taro_038474 [Colocasia esculenta]|uniref:Uncharacterized protein n=1 Tax=Colocasia esculenta TaxID=4460 RepID=A0A843W6S7_COLES|nr:hypothetical protein [Colocasia esculenta]